GARAIMPARGAHAAPYSYCSEPRALPARAKYRAAPEGPVRYANLMYDRRVVRGNTYALQVLPGLFDFDIEVKPMLEVLIGKTIEQSLLEVMEEEELANLRAHQRAYGELRNAELAEVQRLEEQERRYSEEKERRKRQRMEMLQKQKETTEKIAARAFAQRYLADLIPSVFNNLRESGYFYDPIERDIETEFLPWLMTEVEEALEKKVLGRTVLDSLICTVVGKRLDAFSREQLPGQTEIRAEELVTTDAAPEPAGLTEDTNQPAEQKEVTEQPLVEEQVVPRISLQSEESDQAEMEDFLSEEQEGKSSHK
uniref:Radial spoke head 3 n=1 Tax=Nothoprocta perdicaria TaxID=30464 RepID=A0A8C7EDE8_NOTPE